MNKNFFLTIKIVNFQLDLKFHFYAENLVSIPDQPSHHLYNYKLFKSLALLSKNFRHENKFFPEELRRNSRAFHLHSIIMALSLTHISTRSKPSLVMTLRLNFKDSSFPLNLEFTGELDTPNYRRSLTKQVLSINLTTLRTFCRAGLLGNGSTTDLHIYSKIPHNVCLFLSLEMD